MNLQEFRAAFPFRPYELVFLRGADDKVMKLVEVISWPWENGNGADINIRLVPNDPGTLSRTDCANLIRFPKKCRCKRCNTVFEPELPDENTNIEDLFVSKKIQVCSAFCADRNIKTLMVSCPRCHRGYHFVTQAMKDDHDSEGKVNTWHCDRPLEVLEEGFLNPNPS